MSGYTGRSATFVPVPFERRSFPSPGGDGRPRVGRWPGSRGRPSRLRQFWDAWAILGSASRARLSPLVLWKAVGQLSLLLTVSSFRKHGAYPPSGKIQTEYQAAISTCFLYPAPSHARMRSYLLALLSLHRTRAWRLRLPSLTCGTFEHAIRCRRRDVILSPGLVVLRRRALQPAARARNQL
jgi:hypothetical protein